jgi:cytochrome P450
MTDSTQSPPRRPVSDWATDFDHLSEEWAAHAPEITADLRGRCPVAHTERFSGAYLVTRYDDVVAVAQDTATFSNRITAVNENKPENIRLEAPPITLDPPLHGPVRRSLLPPFAPREVARLVPFVEQCCDRALDALAGRDVVDGALDYAQVIPVDVTARLLGLPRGDGDTFRAWVKGILSEGQIDLELAARCTREVRAFFAEQLEQRRREPGDDLVSWVAHAEVPVDGGGSRPLDDREQVGALYLLLVAGIDTTWSAIGASLHHLSRHPDHRRRLVAEPELMEGAVEELLRFFAPVTMARVITGDGHIGPCPVRGGERLLLSYGSANRDPDHFDRPDDVVLDRAHNRHLAFGVGVHRCLGSNLARMELKVALERWLARYPDFEPAGEVRWTIGVRGPRTVPLRLR